jgi:thymidylate kinase
MPVARIIIEGPDCSGKSTLVERIKNALRWDSKSLHHREGRQYERYLYEYAVNKQIVFDRSHFSEIVYSTLWRGGNPFSKEEQNILNQIVQLNTIIIAALPSEDKLKERYNARNYAQQIKLEELTHARTLFLETLKYIPHIIYKSETYEELDKLVERVKNETLCDTN